MATASRVNGIWLELPVMREAKETFFSIYQIVKRGQVMQAKWITRAHYYFAGFIVSVFSCFLFSLPAYAKQPGAGYGQLNMVKPLSESASLDNYPHAGKSYLVSYMTRDYKGRLVPAFGQVMLPVGTAPEDGFPVVAFAPGTTGLAPQCASSLAEGIRYDDFVDQWLEKGYAVLKSDYQGFDVSGPRVVLDGTTNAADIAGLVIAAHDIDDVNLANQWLAVGHSEGGGSVLWLASLDHPAGKSYPLIGVVAAAPTGTGVADMLAGAANTNALPGILQGYVAMTILSAKVQDESVNMDALVNPSFMPVIEDARVSCMPLGVDDVAEVSYINHGDDFDKVVRFVETRSYLPNHKLNVPALIVAGLTDESSVSADLARDEAKKLCQAGSVVEFQTFATQSHQDILPQSFDKAVEFGQYVSQRTESVDYGNCAEING